MSGIDNKELGKRIRHFREQRKMAIEDLAVATRIPWAVLADIESGMHFPTMGRIERLLAALQTTWPELTAELFD